MSLNLISNSDVIMLLTGILFTAFNELEDACVRGKFPILFFNSTVSWKNKWKISEDGALIPYQWKWYHLNVNPKFEERFPFSSTILVFLTDGEHLFQFLKIQTISLGVCLAFGFSAGFVFTLGVTIASLYKELYFNYLD